MPPLVFSSAYYLVATTVLSIGTLSSADSRSAVSSAGNDSNALRGASSDETRDSRVDGASLETANNFGAVSGLSLSTRGGIELGTYLFIGNALQVFGLKTVPSDRAAFLLQLTTLFVPLLKSATVKAEIPLVTWLACLVALLGVALIGLDDESAAVDYGGLDSMKNYGDILYNAARLLDRLPSFSVEDGYIVLAAVFYTFHCIRLETYARSTASPIGLATAKATTETLWSGLVIVGCVVAAGARGVESGAGGESTSIVDTARISGETILSYGKVIQQQISSPQAFASGGWPRVGLATLWVGAVTVAYTIYAQSFGQSRVSAVTANLIYSSQPIFTALVAYYLLGESLGINGYIGGMLIGLAVLLVIAAEAETEQLVTMDRADD
jgi:drug/metabolite transporter (DMT)-like permease